MTGIEEILIEAAIRGGVGSVTKVASETFLDGSGWLAKRFGSGLKERTRQAIYHASRQYVRNYAKRHCILKIRCVGMGEPVSLDSIYTNVRLLEARNVLKFVSQEEMEQAFRETKERYLHLKIIKPEKG